MKSACKKLRDAVAERGPAALAGYEAAEQHLLECDDCLELVEAMAKLDETLAALPGLDAPDETVEALLARPELAEPASAAGSATEETGVLSRLLAGGREWLLSMRSARRRWGLVAVPALVLIGVAILVLQPAMKRGADEAFIEGLAEDTKRVSARESQEKNEVGDRSGMLELEEEQHPSRSIERGGLDADQRALRERLKIMLPDGGGSGLGQTVTEDETDERLGRERDKIAELEPGKTAGGYFRTNETAGAAGEGSESSVKKPKLKEDRLADPVAPKSQPVPGFTNIRPVLEDKEEISQESGRVDIVGEMAATEFEPPPPPGRAEIANRRAGADLDAAGERRQSELSQSRSEENRPVGAKDNREREVGAEAKQRGDDDTDANALDRVRKVKNEKPQVVVGAAAIATDGSAARRFLAERAAVDDLDFADPHSYWSNTYVPGDRTLRRLQLELAGWDRSSRGGLALHDLAHQPARPYDPPRDTALALYLRADRAGVTARERLLLEVGLKGTARGTGRRPAMNVGVVLDLRGDLPVETAAAIRALVEAFAAAHDAGDRFSLTVAGRPGDVIVPPGDFRHGPVTVALRELFESTADAAAALSLPAAVESARATVREGDDPTAPLGSSVVVLVTSQPIGRSLSELAIDASAAAVDGIPMSVIGVGEGVRIDELDRLVLTGQGNRRLLATAADARSLVDRELAAVGRTVARAVRLNIRLAPGVQLVDVIGSVRLDEAKAQEVRDAETSIDRRMASNLGITADRGLDEDGVQIVIPAFYADDEHAVLLDVVAPGPGPLAEVTVRYKDLVYLRNGTARAQLELGRRETTPGPLELAVLKGLLAHRLGDTLELAGAELAAGRTDETRRLLVEMKTLLAELPQELPGLDGDPDLEADGQLLDEYLSVVGDEALTDEARALLRDSLHYSGRLKVLPAPQGLGE